MCASTMTSRTARVRALFENPFAWRSVTVAGFALSAGQQAASYNAQHTGGPGLRMS